MKIMTSRTESKIIRSFTKIQLRILAKNPHSVVVRRPDSAIHQIVIFQALLNQSLIGITRVLKFSIYKLNVF